MLIRPEVPSPEHWIVAMWVAAILTALVGLGFLVEGAVSLSLACFGLAALLLILRRAAPVFDRDRRW